jgi:uncharacterized protein YqcC (DUF446 family)
MRISTPDALYSLASAKANEIEVELKLLRRWTMTPLPAEKFENMGAFGCNTMSFEQWLQFVLIPRVRAIILEKDTFPQGSMLGPYAIRVFDGDLEASHLHDLLYELDEIVNADTGESASPDKAPVVVSENTAPAETVTLGDSVLPQVLYTLADLLPQFDGDELDSQLQTYDMFISILAPSARREIAQLLINGANKHMNEVSKTRIRRAAESILKGGRATEPYDHGTSMRNYRDNLNKDRD